MAEGSRPADVYIPQWGPRARDVALDVCCISLLQQVTLNRAAREPGYSKYAEPYRPNNIDIIAMAVETTGVWDEGAARVFTRLSKALTRATGQEEGGVCYAYFW